MNVTIKNLALLAAGVIALACLYVLLSPSDRFTIEDGTIYRKGVSGAKGEDTVGRLKTEGEDEIVLAAVGDIMLSRTVEQKMIAKGDWEYPFWEMADVTSGADIAFGNLETSILEGDVIRSGSFTFRTDPKAVEGLRYGGFDVLSLANNHIMNFGITGLESTLRELDAAGIDHVGAGCGEGDINAPVIWEAKGVKFGFLTYSYADDRITGKNGKACGSAFLDKEKMEAQVVELKTKTDVVVVSMHAGTEYATAPSSQQKDFARAAVDAGATLVIGHHPHVVQTFEKYGNGYIIYSLGNFIFDQMWSEETRLGAIAEITFDKETKEVMDIGFVPVKTYDFAQPQPAAGADKDMILKRLEMTEG